MAKSIVTYERIQELLDQGYNKPQIAQKLGIKMDTLIHRITREQAKGKLMDPPPVPGFVIYWKSRGLSREEIVDKIRPARGY